MQSFLNLCCWGIGILLGWGCTELLTWGDLVFTFISDLMYDIVFMASRVPIHCVGSITRSVQNGWISVDSVCCYCVLSSWYQSSPISRSLPSVCGVFGFFVSTRCEIVLIDSKVTYIDMTPWTNSCQWAELLGKGEGVKFVDFSVNCFSLWSWNELVFRHLLLANWSIYLVFLKLLKLMFVLTNYIIQIFGVL